MAEMLDCSAAPVYVAGQGGRVLLSSPQYTGVVDFLSNAPTMRLGIFLSICVAVNRLAP